MTLDEMLLTLDRNHVRGMFVYNAKKRYLDEVVYLENGAYLRHWYFDEHGNIINTYNEPAPDGEMDLLAEFALNIEIYGIECVGWCG